jgi:hypothetical protein
MTPIAVLPGSFATTDSAIEHDFHEAVKCAKVLALSEEARKLPGYCGKAS